MRLRSFINSDPPHIARIWAAQPPSRGVARQVDAQILEDHIYAKTYFDPQGLIVAELDGKLVGFAHSGFGPNERQSDIDTSIGVLCVLLVLPNVDFETVAGQLITQSEEYLQRRGAKVIYAGSVKPLNPFYLGFYGGSELPGLLESQAALLELLAARGYREADRTVTLESDLTCWRPPVDRRILQNKRRFRVELDTSVASRTWWEASTAPPTEMQRFALLPTVGGDAIGSGCYWLVEPLSTSRGAATAGLTELSIAEEWRGRGLGLLLNCEAMKQLKAQRFEAVEAQTMIRNVAAIRLYEKLGFRRVTEGVILRKS